MRRVVDRDLVQEIATKKAKLRFYCNTLFVSEDGTMKTWSDVAYSYILGFCEAEVPIRIVSTTASDLTNEASAWFGIRELFQTPMPGRFRLNFVCGPPGDLAKYHTEKMVNVGITAPKPKNPTETQLDSMAQYDKIVCPSWNIINSFNSAMLHRCKVFCVRPEPEALKELVSTCFQASSA